MIKVSTFEEIYELLRDRLNQVGKVRTDDAWQVCRGKTNFSYPMICNVFRECMQAMVEQGKAKKLEKNGVWEIIKPNEKQ